MSERPGEGHQLGSSTLDQGEDKVHVGLLDSVMPKLCYADSGELWGAGLLPAAH